MGQIHEPLPALLVIPAFSQSADALSLAKEKAITAIGPILRESEPMPFDCTAYYADEMGQDLRLVIWAFAQRVSPGALAQIKHQTNAIEAQVANEISGIPRPVNLDPGLLSLDKLALATTKSRSHRLYIGEGIYAESTLRHYGNSYAPWPWTYPSYQRAEVIAFFNGLREEVLKKQKNRARKEAGVEFFLRPLPYGRGSFSYPSAMLTDHSYGVIAIRIRNHVREFLLVQHKHGAHWAFPKGHAEAGETPIQSAKRELTEETGLTRVALRASPAFEENYYSIKKGVTYDKTITYYMGDVLIDEPVKVQAAEVSNHAWLPFEKAIKRITYPASRELLLEVQAFLTGV